MKRAITIEPITRIEGHARIRIDLDESGRVSDARVEITALRGFEQFVIGRPAEEIPRIVTRICGICPWMHHLAAVKAIDGCFGVSPPPAGNLLRELAQVLAHIHDKILHFFFLAAPDFVLGPESDYSVRNVMGLVRSEPELAARVVRMRQLALAMLERFAGKAIHPVAGVVGGFARPMDAGEQRDLLADGQVLLDFACQSLAFAKERIFSRFVEEMLSLGSVTTGFLGTVDAQGSLRLYDGLLRLMDPGGGLVEFPVEEYDQFLAEHVEPWSYAKMVYARSWGEGISLDSSQPRGIYRANTLARINVCDHIATPRAQEELEAFRELFGRPAQGTLLYHWARLIELVYACERTLELLADERIVEPLVHHVVEPGAGRGIGHVEAPRGTLLHEYATDGNGCITRANLIVGTTHNVAPMQLCVRQAADRLIGNGAADEEILNRIEMAVRAYDP
ncbi:Ni/Fe hydrogenase subunit alpha [Desulfobulbus alkaliphilus]|uniref:Ni/Fe hydrogenase subunit alpha n=1 Tax=Desulfobulbus alkaliphilus TaxID=869814 RepID=UPI00196637CB|nr:Ni/Fe hydrogenase subunit alpha [Desulfobulbus alkaliphilus]MBM9535578.1 Ni/Fe hydrogenase subunit alpha [Desulfobulbus alkaliphilus]